MRFFNRINENITSKKLTNKLIIEHGHKNNYNNNKNFIYQEILEIINSVQGSEIKFSDIQGPEKEDLSINNCIIFDWLLINAKINLALISSKNGKILYNNGITDSIKSTLKQKDNIQKNQDRREIIQNTLYGLVRSFEKRDAIT